VNTVPGLPSFNSRYELACPCRAITLFTKQPNQMLKTYFSLYHIKPFLYCGKIRTNLLDFKKAKHFFCNLKPSGLTQLTQG